MNNTAWRTIVVESASELRLKGSNLNAGEIQIPIDQMHCLLVQKK